MVYLKNLLTYQIYRLDVSFLSLNVTTETYFVRFKMYLILIDVEMLKFIFLARYRR